MSSPATAVTFATSNLAEILRMLVQAKQTGTLSLHNEAVQGSVALENGMILSAKTETENGMTALFQLVSWPDPHFEFKEQPLAADVSRDLADYDPAVLLTGLEKKVGS